MSAGMVLKASERLYGLVAGFARCLVDRREPGKIRHTLAELLGERIFGIACGHPDRNDARRAVCATITPSTGSTWSLQE